MTSPLPYYGGKGNLGPAIARALPPHTHYVEPFCGSLAVLLAKPPARHETVNDLDEEIVAFWRVLRDREEDLLRVCALTPHARGEYAAAFTRDPEGADDREGGWRRADEVEAARRVWVKLTQGRSGLMKRTGWRHYRNGDSTYTAMPGYLAGYVDRMPPAAARLRTVSLECRPALDVIADYGTEPGALLYCDPPYLGSTRTGPTWNGYRHDMTDPGPHRDLAAALRACNAAVIVSGYPSDLYDEELYPDWYRHEMSAFTGHAGSAPNRTEVIWSNRPLPTTQPGLFDVGVA